MGEDLRCLPLLSDDPVELARQGVVEHHLSEVRLWVADRQECRKDKDVIDEIPMAYKDIDAVIHAQRDLVEVVHTLKQIVCVKG